MLLVDLRDHGTSGKSDGHWAGGADEWQDDPEVDDAAAYAVQQLSPYAALLTGSTTVANMFGEQRGRYKGLVSLWDVVAFDEVARLLDRRVDPQ